MSRCWLELISCAWCFTTAPAYVLADFVVLDFESLTVQDATVHDHSVYLADVSRPGTGLGSRCALAVPRVTLAIGSRRFLSAFNFASTPLSQRSRRIGTMERPRRHASRQERSFRSNRALRLDTIAA